MKSKPIEIDIHGQEVDALHSALEQSNIALEHQGETIKLQAQVLETQRELLTQAEEVLDHRDSLQGSIREAGKTIARQQEDLEEEARKASKLEKEFKKKLEDQVFRTERWRGLAMKQTGKLHRQKQNNTELERQLSSQQKEWEEEKKHYKVVVSTLEQWRISTEDYLTKKLEKMEKLLQDDDVPECPF